MGEGAKRPVQGQGRGHRGYGFDVPKKLREYERKRDFSATPEPAAPIAPAPCAPDLPLRHPGALTPRACTGTCASSTTACSLSWAIPNGIPEDPKENRKAVHTEDHPLEYLDFHGEIPKGNYGAGTMTIWDRGTYEPEKFRDDEVIVVFHGERVQGPLRAVPDRPATRRTG